MGEDFLSGREETGRCERSKGFAVGGLGPLPPPPPPPEEPPPPPPKGFFILSSPLIEFSEVILFLSHLKTYNEAETLSSRLKAQAHCQYWRAHTKNLPITRAGKEGILDLKIMVIFQ
jgi:hypothetical protein